MAFLLTDNLDKETQQHFFWFCCAQDEETFQELSKFILDRSHNIHSPEELNECLKELTRPTSYEEEEEECGDDLDDYSSPYVIIAFSRENELHDLGLPPDIEDAYSAVLRLFCFGFALRITLDSVPDRAPLSKLLAQGFLEFLHEERPKANKALNPVRSNLLQARLQLPEGMVGSMGIPVIGSVHETILDYFKSTKTLITHMISYGNTSLSENEKDLAFLDNLKLLASKPIPDFEHTVACLRTEAVLCASLSTSNSDYHTIQLDKLADLDSKITLLTVISRDNAVNLIQQLQSIVDSEFSVTPADGNIHKSTSEAPSNVDCGHQNLIESENNILDALRELNQRTTTEPLLRKALGIVNSNGKQLLSSMVKRGIIDNKQDVDPKGYGLPEWS